MANTSIHLVHSVFSDEPLPTLTWWRNEALIDDTYEVINNETTNILTINRVERKDLNSIFTCQALSQQLDIPVSTQVRLDLTCEYIIIIRVEFRLVHCFWSFTVQKCGKLLFFYFKKGLNSVFKGELYIHLAMFWLVMDGGKPGKICL